MGQTELGSPGGGPASQSRGRKRVPKEGGAPEKAGGGGLPDTHHIMGFFATQGGISPTGGRRGTVGLYPC